MRKGGMRKRFEAFTALFLCLFSMIGVGISSFQLPYVVNESSSVNVTGSDATSMIDIDVKYQITEVQDGFYLYREFEIASSGAGTTSDGTWNNFVNFMNTYSSGFGNSTDYNTGEHNITPNSTWSGYTITLNVTRRVRTQYLWPLRWYYGACSVTIERYPDPVTSVLNDTQLTLQIPSGSTLPVDQVLNNLGSDYASNATLSGFCLADSAGNPDRVAFDTDTTTFSESTTVFAMIRKRVVSTGENNSPQGYLLAGTLNSLTSGTHTFNAGTASGQYDLTKDLSYSEITVDGAVRRTVFLGDASNPETVIKSGVKVYFGLNDGNQTKTNQGYRVSNYEPENAEHTLQYNVVLYRDLEINGEMYIGSSYGVSESVGNQGMIVDEYVCLDLNGHNITINNGGLLFGYGLIKDSAGTGEIIVNGGTLKTLACVMDYRGGGITYQMAQNANEFPFQVYHLPYLRCVARLVGTSGTFGKFEALANICAAVTPSQTVVDIDLKFIGGDSSYLFQVPANNSAQVVVRGYEYSNMITGLASTNSTVYGCLARRIEINLVNASVNMNGIDVVMEGILLGRDVNISTKTLNFPITSFFDIRLTNSEMTIAQRIRLLPGASLVADENSTVVLNHDSEATAQISSLDKSYYYYEKGRSITLDNCVLYTRVYNADGTTKSTTNYGAQHTGSVFTNTRFVQYFTGGNIKVYGDLVFVTGNVSNGRADYLLAGPMDINRIGYRASATGTTNYISYSSSENPFAKLMQTVGTSNTKITTYGFDYMIGSAYYNVTLSSGGREAHGRCFSRPLVSNGVAYATDGNGNSVVGTWDDVQGVLTATNGATYAIDCLSSNNSWQNNDNRGATLASCTVNGDNSITIGGTRYVYFNSMYFQCEAPTVSSTSGYSYDCIATVPTRLVVNSSTIQFPIRFQNTTQRWVRNDRFPVGMSDTYES